MASLVAYVTRLHLETQHLYEKSVTNQLVQCLLSGLSTPPKTVEKEQLASQAIASLLVTEHSAGRMN